jgi:hypothetical protein
MVSGRQPTCSQENWLLFDNGMGDETVNIIHAARVAGGAGQKAS